MKWKGDPRTDEKHRHDYRWRETPKEKFDWILEHYEVTEEELKKLKKEHRIK